MKSKLSIALLFCAISMVSASQAHANGMLNNMIRHAALKYNVDPVLLNTLISKESNHNQAAISSAGAIGYGQLMPETAAELGVDPYDPEQNLDGSARYLRQMLDANQGNVKLALAAYNAGQGAVNQYGGIPPYEETQDYVSSIMGDYKGALISEQQSPLPAPTKSKTGIKKRVVIYHQTPQPTEKKDKSNVFLYKK